MKILYVITKGNWGGAQRYVYDLATAAQAAGHEVAVALGGGGELAARLAARGIPLFPLGALERDLSPGRDLGGYAELARLLREYRPAVVHLNSSKAGGLGALAARRAGVPRIVFTAHGWPFKERRNPAWRLLALLGSYATTLFAHAVIVVSREDLALGRRMPFAARKMHLIYNGIDLDAPLGSGEVIRSAFPRGARITGTIGELNRNKNQIALVEEARHDPQRFVAIVGEGEERPALERAIAAYGLGARVKLFGFIPAAEALRGFDEFALPSLKEGLPYVVIEARAAGLPISARRVGGVGEILEAPDLAVFSKEKMLAATFALYR
ncbi:MAG TPA: glycosyltransferase [Candidatus Paceibacterota bacterium]|nr:glycosyltransferase [Candidatus Paceibacterota bacterium]